MNDYLTPRRRHSSLFQRMEEEIHKISRKLSAAKQHKENHFVPSHRSSLSNHTHKFKEQDAPEPTVRRTHKNTTNSKEFTKKINLFFKQRSNDLQSNSRGHIRRLRFGHQKAQNMQSGGFESQVVSKILQQNQNLQKQLGKMRAICEQQSYKLGYLRAENRQYNNELEVQRIEHNREELYFNKLLEGYKIKVKKYKRICNQEESLEIGLQDL